VGRVHARGSWWEISRCCSRPHHVHSSPGSYPLQATVFTGNPQWGPLPVSRPGPRVSVSRECRRLAREVYCWSPDHGPGGYAAPAAGAKSGAIIHRYQATPSPFRRSIYLSDLTSSNGQPHRATGRISFASRRSEVHRDRFAARVGRGHVHASGPQRTLSTQQLLVTAAPGWFITGQDLRESVLAALSGAGRFFGPVGERVAGVEGFGVLGAEDLRADGQERGELVAGPSHIPCLPGPVGQVAAGV
jgi:hypothetical protein